MSFKRMGWWSCVPFRKSVDASTIFPKSRLSRALMIWYRYYGLDVNDPFKEELLSALLGFSPSFRVPIFAFGGIRRVSHWGIRSGGYRFWLYQGRFVMRIRCDDRASLESVRSFLRDLGDVLIRPSTES